MTQPEGAEGTASSSSFRQRGESLVRTLAEGTVSDIILTALSLYLIVVLVLGRIVLPITGSRLPDLLSAAGLLTLHVTLRAAWKHRASLTAERVGGVLNEWAPEITVALLMLCGLLLRLWGIRFGEPLLLHPDEGVVAGYAIRMLKSGWIEAPEPYHYPTVFLYMLLPAFGLYAARGLSHEWWGSLADIQRTEFGFYYVARVHSAVLGVLSILLVYLLARRMWPGRAGRWSGALAAGFLTFSFNHVRESHFAVTDVAMTFFLLVAFMAILWIWKEGSWKSYAAGGFLCGIACATKYSALPIVAVLVAAHFLGRPARSWLHGKLLLATAMVPVGFFTGYPYALLKWQPFIEHLGWLSGNSALQADPGQRFRVIFGYAMESGMGTLFSLGLISAIVYFVYRRRTDTALAIVMVAVTLGMLTHSSHRFFPRYLVPIIPFAALLVARLLVEVGETIQAFARSRHGESENRAWRVVPASVVLMVAVAMIYPQAFESVRFGYYHTLPDTRVQARDYIVAEFERPIRVASEIHELQLPRGLRVIRESNIHASLSLDDLREQRLQVVVLSSQFDVGDESDAAARDLREQLRSGLRLVQQFRPEEGRVVGPAVSIYVLEAEWAPESRP